MDPENVLENDTCSNRFEDSVSDPIRVLRNEERSRRADESPREPDRTLTKPLASEPVRDNDPVMVRESVR